MVFLTFGCFTDRVGEEGENEALGFQMRVRRDPGGVSIVGERNGLKVLGGFGSRLMFGDCRSSRMTEPGGLTEEQDLKDTT